MTESNQQIPVEIEEPTTKAAGAGEVGGAAGRAAGETAGEVGGAESSTKPVENHFKSVLPVATKKITKSVGQNGMSSPIVINRNTIINLNNIPLYNKANFDKLDVETVLNSDYQSINTELQNAQGRYKNNGIYNQQQQQILNKKVKSYKRKRPLERELNRIVMGLKSVGKEDVMWSLRKLLQLSNATNINTSSANSANSANSAISATSAISAIDKSKNTINSSNSNNTESNSGNTNSVFTQVYPILIKMSLQSITNVNFTTPLNTKDVFIVECSLTSLLILRNLAQDLDHITNLIKLNGNVFKKMIFKYLSFTKKYLYDSNANTQLFHTNGTFVKEFQYYTIDLIEAIASFLQPTNFQDSEVDNEEDQVVYGCLVEILKMVKDKYLIISILRSLSRLNALTKTTSINMSEENETTGLNVNAKGINTNGVTEKITSKTVHELNVNTLSGHDPNTTSKNIIPSIKEKGSSYAVIDSPLLTKIVSFLLDRSTNDDELLLAVLDFLQQYVHQNFASPVENLFSNEQRYTLLTTVFPQLLAFKIKNTPQYLNYNMQQVKLIQRVQPKIPEQPPILPDALFNEILQLNEPERSTAYLRCCFEPDLEAEFTQIKLWRCYDSLFGKKVKENNRKMIAAVDFIKNVSNSISTASAVVFPDPVDPTKKRFVVKGIKPRPFAVGIATGTKLAMIDSETLQKMSKNFTKLSTSNDKQENKDKKSNTKTIELPQQTKLHDIKFPTKLSDVSNTTTVLLNLLSKSNNKKCQQFCLELKPMIMRKIVDIPPLAPALKDYLKLCTNGTEGPVASN